MRREALDTSLPILPLSDAEGIDAARLCDMRASHATTTARDLRALRSQWIARTKDACATRCHASRMHFSRCDNVTYIFMVAAQFVYAFYVEIACDEFDVAYSPNTARLHRSSHFASCLQPFVSFAFSFGSSRNGDFCLVGCNCRQTTSRRLRRFSNADDSRRRSLPCESFSGLAS